MATKLVQAVLMPSEAAHSGATRERHIMQTDTRILMSLKQVQSVVPFSRSTIYAKIKTGDFPAPVRISENRVAWNSDAVAQWIADALGEAA